MQDSVNGNIAHCYIEELASCGSGHIGALARWLALAAAEGVLRSRAVLGREAAALWSRMFDSESLNRTF